MKVIVGLGNPGNKYEGTRHNVGFGVIDYLAAAPDCAGFRSRFQGLVAEVREGTELLMLVKPQTYMNLSGQCVREVLDFYKLSPEDLLIVCDDFNLPLGKLRVRARGSHGGQNGLRNIQMHLGSEVYARLRIGVGSPRGEPVDHVLGRFRSAELDVAQDAIRDAANACLLWTREGVEACMNRVNGAEKTPPMKKSDKDKATDTTSSDS